jgi:uncharacterized protein (UPF0262 family)
VEPCILVSDRVKYSMNSINVPSRVNEIESCRKGVSDEVDFTIMNRLKGPVRKIYSFLRDHVVAFHSHLLPYTIPISGVLLQFMLTFF